VAVRRVAARRSASRSSPVIRRFRRVGLLGVPQVFLIEESVVGEEGDPWFRVLLPVRPNGTTGYVPAGALEVTRTPYRLHLDRDRFRLRLFRRCRVIRTFTVGIGTGRTPTPVGRFYLASLLKLPVRDTVYGPYAYGLSGFSNVLRTWRFGGIIGLHGTNDPSSIGRRSSHGCIRLRNRDIRQLVPILPLGTPIEIT
jgi:hypothetical protein